MYMYLQYVTNVTFDFTNFTIEFTIYGPQARNFPGGSVHGNITRLPIEGIHTGAGRWPGADRLCPLGMPHAVPEDCGKPRAHKKCGRKCGRAQRIPT